jgi:predicted TIM-barrel fold metal-dependent hydrolase
LVDRGDPTRTIHYDRLEGPIKLARPHPNLYMDLAAYQHLILKGEEFPYVRAQKVVEILAAELGADHVVWGTDWPYLGEQPYPELIRSIREAHSLSQEDVALILGGNAKRIFSL